METVEDSAAFSIVIRDGRSGEVYQDFKGEHLDPEDAEPVDAVDTCFRMVYANIEPYIQRLKVSAFPESS